MKCPRCGKPVPPPVIGVPLRRWCSDTCRTLANRDRRRAGIPPDPEMLRRVNMRRDRVNAHREADE